MAGSLRFWTDLMGDHFRPSTIGSGELFVSEPLKLAVGGCLASLGGNR